MPAQDAEYWASQGRDRENPTLGMSEDEKYAYYFPESVSAPDHTGDSDYYQPGEAEYNKPDYSWAKTQSPEQLAAGGYSLTPSQLAQLNPTQQVNYLNTTQGTDAFDPRFPGAGSPMGAEANIKHPGPNWLTKLGIGALQAGVAAGFGSALSGAIGGAGASAGSSSAVPGLSGLSGLEAGAFPLTTAGASGLEASLFPLTTAGAGSGAGLGALGAGASALDLSNIATQSTIPHTDYLTLENLNRARKGLGALNQLTSSQSPSQGEDSGDEQYEYDPNASISLSHAPSLSHASHFAEGGYLGGGITDLYETPDGMKKGGYLEGPGDGMSDSIPAVIEGNQPAALADGEYVLTADTVSHIGNGSSKAGAKWLDGMVSKLRKARTGNPKQGKQINPNQFLPN